MSTKTKTATVLSQADTESNALPWVRKPGLVPIMSWAVPLEGSALKQATNLSNLPFAIDHVALMPDAHTGYGMPIGGVLFADRAVVPYAIGVDIGCGVALVETDLTVETLAPHELDRVLEAIDGGVVKTSARHPSSRSTLKYCALGSSV